MRRLSIQRGFTLIELMVTISIAGLLILLAIPSFQDMILTQRVRGVSSQLTTDLHFSRAEAVTRSSNVIINLRNDDSAQTCYSIYFISRLVTAATCDCRRGAGQACVLPNGNPIPGYQEIKTVSIPKSGGVELAWPSTQGATFAFDYVTGGLLEVASDSSVTPSPPLVIDVRADDLRQITTVVNQVGRLRACGSSDAVVQRMQVPAC